MSDREQKLRFYATAPKASARKIHQIVDGDFKSFWLATLRGKAVTLVGGQHKLNSREQAVEHARQFREACRKDLAELESQQGKEQSQ